MLVVIGCGAIGALLARTFIADPISEPTNRAPTASGPKESTHTPKVASSPREDDRNDSGDNSAPIDAREALSRPMSTLAKYPGFGHRDEEDEETFTREEQQREEMVAECMRASGFDYTPAPSILADQSVLENEDEFERLLAEAASDPNQAYVDQLSPSMRESYYLALTGLRDPNIEEGFDQEQGAQSSSCVSRAFGSVPGVYAKRNSLEKELDLMESDIENDQRLTASLQGWSSCMSELGHEFAKPSDVYRYVDQAIISNLASKGDAAQNNQHALSRLQQQTDQCALSAELEKMRQQVRIEHENKFVGNNKDRLEN